METADCRTEERVEYLDLMKDPLGYIIYRERKEMKLTQDELATKLKTHKNYISSMETGYRKMSLTMFSLIMKQLGYEVKIALVKKV